MKHGCAKKNAHTPTYKTWKNMMNRCQRKIGCYKNVKVCKRWHDFRNFLEDMGRRPNLEMSIDRINPKKGYRPSNCRWLPLLENIARGGLAPRFIIFHGKAVTVSALSKKFGIPQPTLHKRLFKHGWDINDAVSLPLKRGFRYQKSKVSQ